MSEYNVYVTDAHTKTECYIFERFESFEGAERLFGEICAAGGWKDGLAALLTRERAETPEETIREKRL